MKRCPPILAVLILLATTLFGVGSGACAGTSQPELKWSYTTGSYILNLVIAPDGIIYVQAGDNNLYAINPDGTLKWSYALEAYPSPILQMASDGTAYVSVDDNNLYAVTRDGTLKWSRTIGDYILQYVIASDGTVYVGSRDGNLYAINPDGTLKWSYNMTSSSYLTIPYAVTLDGTVHVFDAYYLYAVNPNGMLKWSHAWPRSGSAPVVDSDGTIYFGSALDNNLYAINPDGTLKWSYPTGGYISFSCTLAADGLHLTIPSDGTVYVSSRDNNLYAINPDGTLKWSYSLGGGISGFEVAPDGTVYVGSFVDENLYVINPDGTLKWSYHIEAMGSSLEIAPDGTVYVNSYDGSSYSINLYAINPDGTLKWSYSPGDRISGFEIALDGTVYVGSWDHNLYAISGVGGSHPGAGREMIITYVAMGAVVITVVAISLRFYKKLKKG